jgi:hypothetical protein
MRQQQYIGAVALLAMGLFASAASATHNHPKTATKLKMSLVRAYSVCSGSPNTFNSSGLPACDPPVASTSVLKLGPKSVGTLTINAIKRASSADVKLSVKITDVRDSGDVLLNTALDCSDCPRVSLLFRSTEDNCQNTNPCTTYDTPPINVMSGQLPRIPCVNGVCKLTTTVNTEVPGMVMPGHGANAEIWDIEIRDSSNNAFMRPGLYLP